MANGETQRRANRWRRRVVPVALTLVGILTPLTRSVTSAQEQEPILAVGHGGLFDQRGRQIPVSLGFTESAQAWYRARLLGLLNNAKVPAFNLYEQRLYAGLTPDRQERLLLQHEALEWLVANVDDESVPSALLGKLRLVRYLANWRIPVEADLSISSRVVRFTPSPEVVRRLIVANRDRVSTTGTGPLNSITTKSGQAYIDECAAAGVPIPPSINVMDEAGEVGWKSQGFIPPSAQFIEKTPAEVRTFKAPNGMCIALPRYTDATLSEVMLDGVICLSTTTSKVCIWDNQWTTPNGVAAFPFSKGEVIPIGVPLTPGGKYQGGGAEIGGGISGICTDCHAGDNPYIIHPDLNLAPAGATPLLWGSLRSAPQNLPMTSANRYDPIVADGWPENKLSQAASTVPAECRGCHVKGNAGRLPHLSNKLEGYCKIILSNALTRTMPQGAPGSATAAGNAFKEMWCNGEPDSNASDSGDPHITTVNNVHYDFQAAGEFVALRGDDFELQTRQTPVLTSFTPDPDPYSGLSSCLSVNTAIALRVAHDRITFQGGLFDPPTLRLNGVIWNPPDGFALADGSVIKRGLAGQVEVRTADGTRVIMIPLFWATQGYWYIDLQIFDTPAREGVMGPVFPGDWLPRAPDGASFGPRPLPMLERHRVLNQKFADAWRVNATSSLFDYSFGTSGSDYTDRNWPTEPQHSCTSTTVRGRGPIVLEPQPVLAQVACATIIDRQIKADCIYDVTFMADVVAARGHIQADVLKQAAAHPKHKPSHFP